MHLSDCNSKEKRSERSDVFHSYLTLKPTSGASIVVSVSTLQLAWSGSYIIHLCECEVEEYVEGVGIVGLKKIACSGEVSWT